MNTHNGKGLTNEVLEILAIRALTSKEVTVEQAEAQVETAKSVHEKFWAFRSWVLEITKDLRFEMMGRGELVLKTSTFKAPEQKPLEIDWEVIDFLRRNQ